VFDVTVQWNGKELPGSPFHPKIVDPRKVRVIGGWEAFMTDDSGRIQLLVNQETRISFDVSEAGPGKLTADVKYARGNKSDDLVSLDNSRVEQTSPARFRLSFVPVHEGEHYIHLFWLDYPVPKTPVIAYAEDLGHPAGTLTANGSAVDHNRVVLRGHGLATAKCGEEAEFIIDGSAVGSGAPEVR
jgi:filamin